MPIFNYRCLLCEETSRKLLTPEQAKAVQECKCGGQLARVVTPPATRVLEVLDNGVMGKRLERLADAERVFQEHATKGK